MTIQARACATHAIFWRQAKLKLWEHRFCRTENEPISSQLSFTAGMVGVQEVKQKMAARLIKQLVFGKKNLPPQPPKPDYTAIKSTSTESSLARSPTSDRSSTSLPPTTSQLGEFEVPQLPGSPHRVAPTEKGGFGGARPKDSGGGVSPKSAPGDRASVSLADEPETPGADQKENTEGAVRGPGASATPVSQCKQGAVKVTWQCEWLPVPVAVLMSEPILVDIVLVWTSYLGTNTTEK